MRVSVKSTTTCSARTMQSAGVVVLLVVVACACNLALSTSSVSSGATPPNHPRHTLLALVRAASALSPPLSHPHNYNHGRQQQQTYSLAHRPSFEFTPVNPRHVIPESPGLPKEPPEDTQLPAEEEREVWAKRSPPGPSLEPEEGGAGQEEEVLDGLHQVGASLATNFLRHARSSARPYDVPQIECPPAEDQMERFPCPSPDRMGRYRCIDDHVLCDGFIDCPDGEDEDRQQCMFYKTTKAHLDVIADAIIRFIRGRK